MPLGSDFRIAVSKSLYLLSFSKILSDTLVSLGTDISMRKQVLSLRILQLGLAYLPRLSCIIIIIIIIIMFEILVSLVFFVRTEIH